MHKKYELTDETRKWYGHTLHRIRALADFGDVEAGDLGGWIEKEENLSHDGNAWVYGNARVYDNACVYDDAWIYGNARVYGNAEILKTSDYFTSGPIGSRNATITFFRCKDGKIRATTGCFYGDLDQLEAAVRSKHQNNNYAQAYMAVIAAAKAQIGADQNV